MSAKVSREVQLERLDSLVERSELWSKKFRPGLNEQQQWLINRAVVALNDLRETFDQEPEAIGTYNLEGENYDVFTDIQTGAPCIFVKGKRTFVPDYGCWS